MHLEPGERLGPYEIVDLLGAGGMGEVYRARDSRLGREVAIKVVRPREDGASAERARRLEREARTVAALDHPNLLTLFDVGHHDGALFLVTELLRGESLRQRLERAGRLSATEVATIGEALARGLAAAHAHGVVHRDLKPDNVFLTADGRTKILDFGLAAQHEAISASDLPTAPTIDQTAEGTVLGTAPYLSPEQARGERAEPRSDLFALGTLLHECLTGVSPFRRSSFAETVSAVLRDTPQPAPGALGDLIERCMAKSAADRPASADDVAARLHRIGRDGAGVVGPARSIAVLPFVDMSAARDQGYLCEGIAEEILYALSRIDGLRVAARTSSFQFGGGGHDLRDVGRKLGVDAILEGSVRRAGDRLRVTVQLVDAATGYRRWAERYDRNLEDVFAIQDEIAASVARALSAVLTDGVRSALRRRGTLDVAAYEAYLRGRRLAAEHKVASAREAVREFERALEIDPDYAAAWAGLADAYGILYQWHGHAAADLAAAERASERALHLDAESPEALTTRGLVLMLKADFEGSERAFRAALERAPGSALAHYLFARLRFSQGRMAEAVELFESGAAADPDDYQCLVLAVMAYETLGQADALLDCARRALARVERRLEIAPDDVRALYLGAGALQHLGDVGRARLLLDRAVAVDPGEPTTLYNVACFLARTGEVEPALDMLDRVVGLGFGQRDWFEHDTDLASLRDSPRFRAILDRMP
ncbi:MAG: protein kinase [Thermoanaerobaculia bacterium]|nr:protein kinase [Thermoanaerobaculia bacterium]